MTETSKKHFSQFPFCGWGVPKCFKTLKLAETSKKTLFTIDLMWGVPKFFKILKLAEKNFSQFVLYGGAKFFQILTLAETSPPQKTNFHNFPYVGGGYM